VQLLSTLFADTSQEIGQNPALKTEAGHQLSQGSRYRQALASGHAQYDLMSIAVANTPWWIVLDWGYLHARKLIQATIILDPAGVVERRPNAGPRTPTYR
jgi:hypothetical protein